MESLSVMELAEAMASKLSTESLSIDDLRSLVSLFKSMLNDAQSHLTALCTPISRLPDEILCSIFQSCEKVKPDPGILWPMSSRIQSRFTLTHICRRWRNVALSCPFLWSNIHFDGDDYELAHLLLQRSQTVPIHLSVSPEALNEPIMLDCIPRVRELNIISTWYEDVSDWQTYRTYFLIHCTAPRLETLTVNLDMVPSSGSWVDLSTEPTPPLLQGRAPNLKRLSFDGVCWLTGNQSKRLTHLCLSHCVITATPLIALLSSNPGLEELIISNCSGPTDGQLSSDSSCIQLNNMRRLGLSGGRFLSSSTLWLIRHVEFGPSTSVHLRDPHLFADVLENLRITGRRQGLQNMDTMALTSSETEFHAISVIKGSELGFCMGERDMRGHTSSSKSELIQVLPPNLFPSVRELWLPCDWYNDYTYLDKLLNAFPALETLVLCEEHLRPLLDKFPNHSSTSLLPEDHEFPCLNLKGVHIFVRQLTDTLVHDLRSFATMLATWCPPLTVFDVGFPDSDAMEEFSELIPNSSALLAQPVRLKLFSEMPVFKAPPASTMADHVHWRPWGQTFPLSLFN